MSSFLSEFPDDELQTKEIYAVFGLAAYMASVFEEAVAIDTTMMALLQDLPNIKSEADWQFKHDEEMSKAHRLSLGMSLRRLNEFLAIPDEVEQIFQEALRTRNYIIHHFFRDRIGEFYTAAGRSRLHETLIGYVELFKQADCRLTQIQGTSRRCPKHAQDQRTQQPDHSQLSSLLPIIIYPSNSKVAPLVR